MSNDVYNKLIIQCNDVEILIENGEFENYERNECTFNKYDLKYYFNIIQYDLALKKLCESLSLKNATQEEDKNDSSMDYGGLFDGDNSAVYFDEVKILVIEYFPIYEIYKMGQTFEECKFLGSEFMDLNISEFIDEYIEVEEI